MCFSICLCFAYLHCMKLSQLPQKHHSRLYKQCLCTRTTHFCGIYLCKESSEMDFSYGQRSANTDSSFQVITLLLDPCGRVFSPHLTLFLFSFYNLAMKASGHFRLLSKPKRKIIKGVCAIITLRRLVRYCRQSWLIISSEKKKEITINR